MGFGILEFGILDLGFRVRFGFLSFGLKILRFFWVCGFGFGVLNVRVWDFEFWGFGFGI